MSKFTALQPLQQPNQTMNSLQIAELVQSKHSSVKRTIERLAEQEVIQLSPMVKVENPNATSNNKVANVYVFSGEQGKLDSITVVAQLSPNFTARLVKRWQQLEHLVSSSDYEQLKHQNQALKAQLLKQNPQFQTIQLMHDVGLTNAQMAGAVGLAQSTIDKRLRTLRSLGIISYQRGSAKPQSNQPSPQPNPQLALEV